MNQRALSGIAIGSILGSYTWFSTADMEHASAFPDAVSLLLAVTMFGMAMRRDVRRSPSTVSTAVWKRGLAISIPAGVLFGSVCTLMMLTKLDVPFGILPVTGFGMAFFSLVVIGLLSSWFTSVIVARK